MKKEIPPFYPNPSDSHCCQCCLKMGFEYFDPSRTWSWKELEDITGKQEGMLTWPMKLYQSFPKLGYETVLYDPIDYLKLADDPQTYLATLFSEAFAAECLQYSDMNLVKQQAEDLVRSKEISIIKTGYDRDDLKKLLDEGFILITWVDHAITWGVPDKCWPHDILIYDYEDDTFFAHDPGGENPEYRQASRPIPWSLLDKANRINERDDRGEVRAFRPRHKAT